MRRFRYFRAKELSCVHSWILILVFVVTTLNPKAVTPKLKSQTLEINLNPKDKA